MKKSRYTVMLSLTVFLTLMPGRAMSAADIRSVSAVADILPAAGELPLQSAVTAVPLPEGTAGRLTIASLGIAVPLYALNMRTDSAAAQSVVDAEQSAAYMLGFASPVIADHASQADFRNIAQAAGHTAVITRDGEQTVYVCTGAVPGINTGTDLKAGKESYLYAHHGDLIMYTCIGRSGRQVWITVWNRI